MISSCPRPGQLNVVSVSTAPAEQERHLQPDDGDHRHERVAERVPVDDRALADAAGACRLDVVVLQRPDHVDPDQADEDAAGHEPERCGRKDQVLEDVPEGAPVPVDDRVEGEDVRVRLERGLRDRARLIRGR